MKTHGKISTEMEVEVPVSQAWDLYGTLKLIDVVVPDLFKEIKILEGDGGEGTILDLIFNPGAPFASYEERIHKVDDENMVKEIDVSKGGFLDLGFTLFRICWEVIEKTPSSCITRVSITFDVKEDSVANLSYVSILPFIGMMKATTNYLLKNQTK